MILNIRSAITTLQADLTSGFKIWMQQKCPGFCWASAGTWILPMHKQIDRITAYLANIMHNIWVKTYRGKPEQQSTGNQCPPRSLCGGGGSVGTLRWQMAGFAITIFWVRAWPDPLNRLSKYWYADVRILRSKSERKGTGHPTASSSGSVRMLLYTVDMYLASTCVWVQLWYAVINYWPTRYCYYRLSQL